MEQYVSKLVPVAVFTILSTLVLAAAMAWQNAESRCRNNQSELDRLGAIKIADASRLHARLIPYRGDLDDFGWRIYVPANKAFQIEYEFEIPNSSLDKVNASLFEIPSSDVPREVVCIVSISHRSSEKLATVQTRFVDSAHGHRFGWPLTGIEQKFWNDSPMHLVEWFFAGAKATIAMEEDGPMLLASLTAHDYPEDVQSGQRSVGDWKKSISEPGYGYRISIEPVTDPELVKEK